MTSTLDPTNPHSSTGALRWGHHYPPIEHLADDLHVVEHDSFRDIGLRMLEAVKVQAMMRISGPVGHGKSFAAGRAAEMCEACFPGLVVTWVELPGATKGRALAALLYQQITGLKAPAKATLADLRTWLVEELRKERHLVICDEAQHVSTEAMHLLRWLYDAAGSQLTVVFCGVPDQGRPFPPEIRSRCLTHIRMEPIADADAFKILSQWHPLFAGMDPALVERMNKRDAKGEWRWWAKFLARAALYHPEGEPLTREMAAVIVHDMERT